MDALSHLAEARIRDAIAAGEFDHLPGAGRPLELEDLSRVPEELRAGYLLLKGQGFAPLELEWKRDVLELRDLLAACGDGALADDLRRDLRRAELRLALLEEQGGRRVRLDTAPEYRERLAERLAGDGTPPGAGRGRPADQRSSEPPER